MNKVNYNFLTLLNPAVGGTAKPNLTGWKLLPNSLTLVKQN